MSSPSDAEVIGRSLGEPEAFGLIYDRHAATLLRFLGRRVGAEVAEGLFGELFRIAFERRKTFDASRVSALPWLYGIGPNLLQYISVHVDDVDAHYQRARAAGARIANAPRDHVSGRTHRAYEALDLEGHRWRFVQWMRDVPRS